MHEGKQSSQGGLRLGRERVSAWVRRAGFLEEVTVLPGAATQNCFLLSSSPESRNTGWKRSSDLGLRTNVQGWCQWA